MKENGSKFNPKSIGEKSEGMVLAKFLQIGWIVLIPFGDNQRYDFVIDRGFGFERVQVKTGRYSKGSLEFKVCSSQVHRNKGTSHYRGQCDLFSVYEPKLNKFYLISVNECGINSVKLRIDQTKSINQSKIKWAKDYEI